ncbi:hypothetical protein ABKV19_009140 [Rosa sericea]
MIMKILPALLFFLLATLVSAIQASDDALSHQIHLLRPQTGSRGSHVPGISCLSWRLGVETHNIIDWETVPAACEGYVGHYMLGHQYRKDSKAQFGIAVLREEALLILLREEAADVFGKLFLKVLWEPKAISECLVHCK